MVVETIIDTVIKVFQLAIINRLLHLVTKIIFGSSQQFTQENQFTLFEISNEIIADYTRLPHIPESIYFIFVIKQ